ncbi:MAG: hypothetical protein AAGG48_10745 [Planctomycetota bacterium]
MDCSPAETLPRAKSSLEFQVFSVSCDLTTSLVVAWNGQSACPMVGILVWQSTRLYGEHPIDVCVSDSHPPESRVSSIMRYDFSEIAKIAKSTFTLSLKGPHGLAHWQRVQENGLKLAKYNGANKDIVRLFSFLHDCCREDDRSDPEHGPRAAELTERLRNDVIHAEDDEFAKLVEAIRDHTSVVNSNDVDIATCWDADRLDIGRVGLKPNKRFLNTDIAKKDWVLNWAYKRSKSHR